MPVPRTKAHAFVYAYATLQSARRRAFDSRDSRLVFRLVEWKGLIRNQDVIGSLGIPDLLIAPAGSCSLTERELRALSEACCKPVAVAKAEGAFGGDEANNDNWQLGDIGTCGVECVPHNAGRFMTRLESESVSGRAAADVEDVEDALAIEWRGGMYGGGGASGACATTATAAGGDGDEARECECEWPPPALRP